MWTWVERWRRRAALKNRLEEDRMERLEARAQTYRDRDATNSIASVATALGSALDRTFQIESKLLEQMGGFLSVLEEASARKAAAVLGARGGRAAGVSKARKRLAGPTCPLCADPMRRDVTIEMVNQHRAHGDNRQSAPANTQSGNGSANEQ